MKNLFSLKGRVALVTGASYGIGFAIATGFANAGATIVFNDLRQELVDRGIAAYRELGIEAHGYVCDVTDESAVGESNQPAGGNEARNRVAAQPLARELGGREEGRVQDGTGDHGNALVHAIQWTRSGPNLWT